MLGFSTGQAPVHVTVITVLLLIKIGFDWVKL
jgi:hypothetical protein